MKFLYHERSGENDLILENQNFIHVIKSRRTKIGEKIYLRNFKDDILYIYEIKQIKAKKSLLSLIECKQDISQNEKILNVGWGIVDIKIIEKTLPILNEMGVSELFLIYMQYSQKNIKINTSRIEKILISSSQQCGRSNLLKLNILNNIDEFLEKFKNTAIFDFGGKKYENNYHESLLIGPEGGFSEEERRKFKNHDIYSFDTNNILQSQNALIAGICKILI